MKKIKHTKVSIKKKKELEKIYTWDEAFRIDDNSEEVLIPCKLKIDMNTVNYWLVEFKTISSFGGINAGIKKIQRQVFDYRYDLQLSFYMRGLIKNDYPCKGAVIVFSEKTFPFECVCFRVDPAVLNVGEYGTNFIAAGEKYLKKCTSLLERADSKI